MNFTLREAGGTKRSHTVPTIGHQTVAEHSFHVAMLVIEYSDGNPSLDLVKAALYHDLPEILTGDVPATAKWLSKELDNELKALEEQFTVEYGLGVDLTDEEFLILKWADSVELANYCIDQRMLGNKFVAQMYVNITRFLNSLPRIKHSDKINNELNQRWNDACR